jgi:endoglycosylceramidase
VKKAALASGLVAVLAVLGTATGNAAGADQAQRIPIARAYAATGDRPLTFLHVGGVGSDGLRQIVDAKGRSVLLRGVNIDGLVDYWQPSLKAPYPSTPAAYRDHRCPADDVHVEGVPICWFDLPQMRRLGYDNIRLNVSWSLLEPTPGHIDERYVARIAQVVGWARSQGIWVTIDMHQDDWSKYVYTAKGQSCPAPFGATTGGDGAPKWASLSRLTACDVDGIGELNLAVQDDAQDFWSDARGPGGIGLQERYATAVAVLAKRFADDPAVAGYDLMNEPQPGLLPEADNTAELLPLYAKVTRAILAAVPGFRQLLFFEPSAERNLTAQRAFFTPWSSVSSYPNAVYAPHVYTDVFTLGAETGLPEISTFGTDYGAAVADAKALGLPLWVGEFGGFPKTDKSLLAQHYRHQEALRIGGTLWLWKENSSDPAADAFWGVYGPPFTGKSVRGIPQPRRVHRTSRVYPVLTAGTLLQATSDPFAGTAYVAATSTEVQPDSASGTLVEVPSVFKGAITVSGARYKIVKRGADREVWLYPQGGRYSLRVHAVRRG